MEGGREGGRKGGKEGGSEGGREGGSNAYTHYVFYTLPNINNSLFFKNYNKLIRALCFVSRCCNIIKLQNEPCRTCCVRCETGETRASARDELA